MAHPLCESDASPWVAEEVLPCPLSCPDPDPARSQRSGKLQQGRLRELPKLLSSAACSLRVLLSASYLHCFHFHFQLELSVLTLH